MKGGTHNGLLTVHRSAVPTHGVPGFHELDPERVSAAGPALRGGVPRTSGGVVPRWEAADGPPVSRLEELSVADPGGSIVVHLGLPENLCAAGGARALVWDGPEQSPSVDPRALACVAGGVAHPRRCPRPFPDRPGPAPRGLGDRRGHGGHAAGRGARPPPHARRPPCAHDGTERHIVRPQDPVEQQESYSGKTRDHTAKNVLLVNAVLVILFLSDTHGGRTHDTPMADATPYPLPAGAGSCRIWVSWR